MNRLQKKCLISAAGFHLLLLLLLFVGPAFLSSHDKANDMAVLDFIPSKLIDAPFSGGGTPNAKPPPPAPPTPPAPQPQATPPEPTPPKTLLQKIFEPDPPKEEKIEKPDPEALQLKKVVIKKRDTTSDSPSENSKPKVDLKLVKRSAKPKTTATDTSEADARAEAKAQARAAAAARQQAFSHSLQTLRNNLSSGTDVAVPGPGGAAYANYAQVVKSVYTQAWNAPDDVADDEATTKVRVVIARDGTVVSARIITPSGSAAVDRSVQETLRRVQFVAPFPEGATDAERSFTINFNLKAKRLLG